MKPDLVVRSLLWLMLACSVASIGDALAARPPVVQSLDVAIPFAPALAQIGDRPCLVYELHLSNFAREPATVQDLAVLDGERPLLALDAAAVSAHARQTPDTPGQAAHAGALTLAPLARGVVYLSVPVTAQQAPSSLRHRLTVSVGDADTTITTGPVAVSRQRPVVLSPPLRGGPWAAAYDPALPLGHRRYLYAVAGQVRIPGRFAVDWFAAGPLSAETGARAADGSGAPVLAVADARVAATRDDVADPAKDQPRTRAALGDASGNYIALDLGDGRYAFYEHLQQGLRVRPGERVRRGQVIARLGTTGQAPRPHLHFHVSDAPSPLDAEGLPFAQSGYTQTGRFDSIFEVGQDHPWQATDRAHIDAAHARLPEPNAVVMFDPAGR